ncbi:MAG: hypothetical protein IJ692_04345 [Alloprevotella sp.]|nr:hypothetical protein [Alloprevotella sp.]MBR1652602.1 hypothetical protein [Alloprevotella sp.]
MQHEYIKPETHAVALLVKSTVLLGSGDTFVIDDGDDGTDIQFSRDHDGGGFAWDEEE